jgi:hypothetical protein
MSFWKRERERATDSVLRKTKRAIIEMTLRLGQDVKKCSNPKLRYHK